MAAPSTPFETSGGASWTTLAQEATFLAAVASGGPAQPYTYAALGTSAGGRTLWSARLGAPGARSPLLVVATQHGNEPAGREAALQFIRDLAYTTDPGLAAYLAAHTVVVIPCGNPDGRAANTRALANGDNLNRDHVQLVNVEARLIQTVVRDLGPDLVMDLHEHGASAYVVHSEYVSSSDPNTDPAVAALAKAVVDNHLAPGIAADGYTSGPYGDPDAVPNGPGTLTACTGLRHSLGITVETHTDRPTLERVAVHRANLREAVDWHAANAATARAVSDAARVRKEGEAITRSRPFNLGGGATVNPPATAYQLTASQQTSLADRLTVHGVMVENGAVWCHQAAQPLIPYLLDPSSTYGIAAGARLGDAPYPYRLEAGNGQRWWEVAVIVDGVAYYPTAAQQ